MSTLQDWNRTAARFTLGRAIIVAALLGLLAFVLSGCASTAGYQGMSAEQIAALAKMKDANINCIIGNSPWGKVVTVYVNLDKGVIPSGGVTVDAECKVTLTSVPAPK